MSAAGDQRPLLILGGSFDPVHCGHVALAQRFATLLKPAELRLIPAGQPWQKGNLCASAAHRIGMLELAFSNFGDIPVVIDRQEIERAARHQASFTVDSLRQIRAEVGARTPLIFVIGADQLQNLHTWHAWPELFELAHLCAASRPGFGLQPAAPEVAERWAARALGVAQLQQQAHGGTLLLDDLQQDISATQLRKDLNQYHPTTKLRVPDKVLDYIQQHHLYR